MPRPDPSLPDASVPDAGRRERKRQQTLDHLAQTAYRVGKQDLRSVEQQALSLYATRVNLLRVRGEQLNQRVALHLSLGGSFGERTVVS